MLLVLIAMIVLILGALIYGVTAWTTGRNWPH